MKRIIFTNGFKVRPSDGDWRYLYILPNIAIIDHKMGALVFRVVWLYFAIDILLKKFNEKDGIKNVK